MLAEEVSSVCCLNLFIACVRIASHRYGYVTHSYFFMEYRFFSVMKELSNISKILSGVGLIILRVLSLSFCLTPILTSRIQS